MKQCSGAGKLAEMGMGEGGVSGDETDQIFKGGHPWGVYTTGFCSHQQEAPAVFSHTLQPSVYMQPFLLFYEKTRFPLLPWQFCFPV